MAKEINLHVKYPRSNHPSFSMALWLQRKRNRSPKHIRILLGSYFVSLEILNFLTSQSILNYLLSLSWYEPWIFCFFILLICQFSFELSALAILIFHLSLEKQWPFFFLYYYYHRPGLRMLLFMTSSVEPIMKLQNRECNIPILTSIKPSGVIADNIYIFMYYPS